MVNGEKVCTSSDCHSVCWYILLIYYPQKVRFFSADVVIFAHFVVSMPYIMPSHTIRARRHDKLYKRVRSLTHWFALEYFSTATNTTQPHARLCFYLHNTKIQLRAHAHSEFEIQTMFELAEQEGKKTLAFSNTMMCNRATYIKLA